MLARSAKPWSAVRAELEDGQADTDDFPLMPLPDSIGPGERVQMFTVARGCFAARYNLPDPTLIEPPSSLHHPDFGLVLALHTAALVAVDAHARGVRPAKDIANLSAYLLNRERKNWTQMHVNQDEKLDFEIPPSVMSRVVFTAALTGGTTYPRGTVILNSLHLQLPTDRVLIDHATCYPPTDPGTVLEPLYPDRLAEDFLALTLPGHTTTAYPPDPWAPSTTDVLTSRDGNGVAPNHIARAITFLASAAAPGRWPHVGQYLDKILRADPTLAIAAGSIALTALADLDLDPASLEAIESHFPEHRLADLDPGIAALTARLTRHRLAATDDPAEHARLYTNLAKRQDQAGLYDHAVITEQQAAPIWRRLVQANPAAHEPNLAQSLNNLGIYLWKEGRRAQEALAVTEEAVAIRRRLAQANPAAYEPDLAQSLSNLGVRLSGMGRREDALASVEEAVTAYRRLAQANPAAYEPDLATAQNNLGIHLAGVGRRAEALAVAEEAVAIWRRLAQVNPAAYEPDLAQSLSNLGVRLPEMGRWEDAQASVEEAVTAYRRLAQANPAAYESNLAITLDSFGIYLAGVGRRAEALAVAEEAVAIWRRLAQANPAAYEPGLAIALNNLGIHLPGVGRRAEALAGAEEAVAIRRRLAQANPAAYEPDLARSLANFSVLLAGVGRQEEALASVEEAVTAFRCLVQANPAAHEPDLATALNNLGARLWKEGRRTQEALAVTEEAVAIRRRLAQANPAAYEPDLAVTLTNLSLVLTGVGRREEARTLVEEAEAIRRRLAPHLKRSPLASPGSSDPI
ncbi:tetratricopeptide repeat protein [Streptomyces sp. NPDC060011]|uniref:tetratricopeptide repeat protein n=1 Tax=Streptomyces sp. NPDC060011 TaxID=3347037 RepID=UPI0036A9AF8D